MLQYQPFCAIKTKMDGAGFYSQQSYCIPVVGVLVMKIRNGFVSNSSSSSFVIKKEYLSAVQVEQIENHIVISKGFPHPFDQEYFGHGWCNNPRDAWEIIVEENNVRGNTNMDNFDMRTFLNLIGVPEEAISWED